jgi:DnaJ-class molecular chaperone
VFRACLEKFKKQLDRDESTVEELLEKARQVLDLKAGDGSKELRKAYRSLARKYHPDKVSDESVGGVGLKSTL